MASVGFTGVCFMGYQPIEPSKKRRWLSCSELWQEILLWWRWKKKKLGRFYSDRMKSF